MKKLLILLLLATGLFAKVGIIEATRGITLYCIDGYVFVTSTREAMVQMYVSRQRDGIPVPRQCTYQ